MNWDLSIASACLMHQEILGEREGITGKEKLDFRREKRGMKDTAGHGKGWRMERERERETPSDSWSEDNEDDARWTWWKSHWWIRVAALFALRISIRLCNFFMEHGCGSARQSTTVSRSKNKCLWNHANI